MSTTIHDWCVRCERCSLAKSTQPQVRAPMGHLLASKLNDILAISFSLLEPATDGREQVLVMTNVFSKFTQVVPTRDQRASTVAHEGRPAEVRHVHRSTIKPVLANLSSPLVSRPPKRAPTPEPEEWGLWVVRKDVVRPQPAALPIQTLTSAGVTAKPSQEAFQGPSPDQLDSPPLRSSKRQTAGRHPNPHHQGDQVVGQIGPQPPKYRHPAARQ